MKCLVTGVAGFIGSHLAERLIKEGHQVVGIDCFTDYYPREIKERNIEKLRSSEGFTFIEANLLDVNLPEMLRGLDYIFHQAAQAGVRASWGTNFEVYTLNNVLTTQKLLEAAKEAPIKLFVYASSSSVYGDAETFPTPETANPKPISPYGVTKLAGEHLCYLYWKNFGVPFISLRYFTVYGPRQRPDMAFHRFIKAMLKGKEIIVYGDGKQTRDFTYIDDAVEANLLAMRSEAIGEVFNIDGGSRITINEAIRLLEGIMGKRARVRYVERQKGDVRHTAADITKAKKMLGYEPKVRIEEGLRREVEWLSRPLC
jgi:UDP-glucose 4-epimerase